MTDHEIVPARRLRQRLAAGRETSHPGAIGIEAQAEELKDPAGGAHKRWIEVLLAHAVEAGRRMECGSIGINDTSFSGAPYPYPAWKESGTGVELSSHGLREFMRVKHIRLRVPALV